MRDHFPIHGGQLREISTRFDISAREVLDFSANINPEGPSINALSALRASVDDLTTLTQYPDMQEAELKNVIAAHSEIPANQIAVANGFVPLLEAVLRTLPIRNCLLPVPSFNEYRRTLSRIGVTIKPHSLSGELNFRYDSEAILDGQPNAVLLANPQNPSGVLCHRDSLLTLVKKAALQNTYILLDEAFIDYEPQHSLIRELDHFQNLIVFRSVTKFYAIPGLRVAYAAAQSSLVQSINEGLPPWPISTLASRTVIAALQDSQDADRTRELNHTRRSNLEKDLHTLGLPTYPSSANFLLFRIPAKRSARAFWEDLIVKHKILLRSCENYEGLPSGYFRVAVREEAANAQLIEALRRQLE